MCGAEGACALGRTCVDSLQPGSCVTRPLYCQRSCSDAMAQHSYDDPFLAPTIPSLGNLKSRANATLGFQYFRRETLAFPRRARSTLHCASLAAHTPKLGLCERQGCSNASCRDVWRPPASSVFLSKHRNATVGAFSIASMCSSLSSPRCSKSFHDADTRSHKVVPYCS